MTVDSAADPQRTQSPARESCGSLPGARAGRGARGEELCLHASAGVACYNHNKQDASSRAARGCRTRGSARPKLNRRGRRGATTAELTRRARACASAFDMASRTARVAPAPPSIASSSPASDRDRHSRTSSLEPSNCITKPAAVPDLPSGDSSGCSSRRTLSAVEQRRSGVLDRAESPDRSRRRANSFERPDTSKPIAGSPGSGSPDFVPRRRARANSSSSTTTTPEQRMAAVRRSKRRSP